MRHIDRFIGIPLCWATGISRMMFTRGASDSVETILVIKFFGIGSILLATPAIHQLRVTFPKARIIFLTFSTNAELVDELTFLDDRWFVNPRSISSFLKSFSLLVARLLRANIDVVVDLEFFSKFSTFLGAIARPGRHIGFGLPTRWRSWNVTDAVALRSDRHVSETFSLALAPLGIAGADLIVPKIHPANVSIPMILQFESVSSERQIICVNPNAGSTSLDRRWDGERFSRVVDILQAGNQDALFCFIGSATETEYVDGIVNDLRVNVHNAVNLAGLLNFRELISLFSISKLLITNDSGPMHAAAAIGLPTVALFGPESPLFYGPLGNKTINLYAGLPCSPCLNVYDAKVFKCPIDRQCMKEISIDQVVEASRSLLKESIHHEALVEVLH